MPPSDVTSIIPQREHADCGIASLAMYLGHSYEDVLRVVSVTDRSKGKRGLWTRTLQRIAKRLGHNLKVKRRFDLDDFGILRLPDHAAILRSGLVIDTDASVWDADEYLAARQVKQSSCQLLVVED